MKQRIISRAARLLVSGLLIVFLSVSIYSVILIWRSSTAGIEVVPDLNAVTLDGSEFSLSGYRGRPALIYFWGTWCPVCRLKYGMISDLASDYQVITIAIQSGTDAEILGELESAGASFRVINDNDGEIAGRYDIRGVPTSLIVDGSGKITRRATGYVIEPLLRYFLRFP